MGYHIPRRFLLWGAGKVFREILVTISCLQPKGRRQLFLYVFCEKDSGENKTKT